MDIPKGNGQKILIVDDDENHVLLLRKRLQAQGYATIEAKDGIDGVNQAIHQRPDLIITDVLLPRMNGFQLVEQLKSNPETNTIPIIMMSAVYVTEEDMARGFEAGAETYVAKADLALRKPLQEEALLEATASLLQREKPKPGAAPPRILIVDDDPDAVRLITKRIQPEGYQLDIAVDGQEALDKALTKPFDLVLLDIRLPKISGLEVLSEIKKHKATMGIIMMTAYGSEAVAVEALRRGADDYLIKPLDDNDLLPTISFNLEKIQRRKEVELVAARLREMSSPDMEEKERLIDELRQSSITLMDQYDRLLSAEDQNRAYAERLEQMVDERTRDLQRRTQELGALHSVLSAATQSLDLPEVLQITLGELEHLLGTYASAAFIVDQDTFRLRLAAQHDVPTEFLRFISQTSRDDGVFAQVIKNGSGVMLSDDNIEPELSRILPDGASLVVFPMKSSNQVVGMIIGICSERKEIDESGWKLLDSVGEEMGVVVENVRLYDNLRQAYLATIRALGEAVDAKDAFTRGHSDRVAFIAIGIAGQMGMGTEFISHIRDAGYLHDIGKIGTPDAVLTKEGALTHAEMETMKLHPGASHRIVTQAHLDEEVQMMIRHHHEHYDGSGYPDGLKGETIPQGSRILAVADAYEAMTAERPYRSCKSCDEAVDEIKRFTGTQFDPVVVDAFLVAKDRIESELEAGNSADDAGEATEKNVDKFSAGE
ncbi:MAG: response regulator [Thermoleophilia bacterium]